MEELSNQQSSPFEFIIGRDKSGKISLTDIWRAAGSPSNKALKKWLELESTGSFINTACRFLKVDKDDLIKIQRGKNGGTWAHKQVALEYAQYLDPRLAVKVNQVFFERLEEEKNPDLAINRGMDTWLKKGKSEKWVQERTMGIATRKYFTKTLQEHGVTGPVGYMRCTDSIYKPLWGGGSKVVREKKQIAKGENLREHMNEVELAGVRLAELLASQNIEEKNITGNTPCANECEKTARNIAQAIIKSKAA
jgi:hypothetical protein